MRIELRNAVVRDLALTDADSIARHLDDRGVWMNLRDSVPHAYTGEHARAFLRKVLGQQPREVFGIEVGGEVVGCCGAQQREDVARCAAELGFWLGRAHWGRGIMSEVVPAVCEHTLATRADVHRLHAEVFGWNTASARVLEKAGFRREGCLRRAVIKAGRITDLLLFGRLREEG